MLPLVLPFRIDDLFDLCILDDHVLVSDTHPAVCSQPTEGLTTPDPRDVLIQYPEAEAGEFIPVHIPTSVQLHGHRR